MKTKRCGRCKRNLPVARFSKNRSRKDGLQSRCKECSSAVVADYIKRNPERKQRIRETNARQRKLLQDYVWEYLSTHPCVDCEESDPVVLQFDHVRGKKERNVMEWVTAAASLDKLLREIARCEVRCANCHTRATYRRARSWRHLRSVG